MCVIVHAQSVTTATFEICSCQKMYHRLLLLHLEDEHIAASSWTVVARVSALPHIIRSLCSGAVLRLPRITVLIIRYLNLSAKIRTCTS